MLDKRKAQTIRPAWKLSSGRVPKLINRNPSNDPHPHLSVCEGCGWNDCICSELRFKVGEPVQLMWKQRSRFQRFCSKCGNGTIGIFTEESRICVPKGYCSHSYKIEGRPGELIQPLSSRQERQFGIKSIRIPDGKTGVYIPYLTFPKLLGTGTITEVFKISMVKEITPSSILWEVCFQNQNPEAGGITYDQYSPVVENLAKRDGFNSTEEFFNYFSKNYDLLKPLPFWVYRWTWDEIQK